MPEEVNVFDPNSGSLDRDVRTQWRINRRAAYRLAYKEREGKQHPASKRAAEKKAEKALLEQVDVPRGMNWNHFGVLWDLHPEHPFTPVLRRRSVDDEWAEVANQFPELPVE
jgi:hypothetical protein